MKWGWVLGLIVGASIFGVLRAPCAWGQSTRENPQSQEIRAVVTQTIVDHTMPGMIAAIADSNGVIAIGAAGFRKAGDAVELSEDDVIHIGSCSKAMTSTMLATLVSDGTLRWESLLVDVIPELKGQIHRDYESATLWQLVTHRARFPENAPSWWAHADLEVKARRIALLKDSLQEVPTVGKGAYQYSNLGYVAAGCMAEAATGETWESLIQARLFDPLGMTTAGFGPPGTPETVDQPWGHSKQDGSWAPSQLDNPEALGPAGRVHCSLADWAKFAALQLGNAETPILSREQLKNLVENTGEYAAGWVVVDREWAQGKALAHSGSNTMWFSTVWVAPKLDRIYLVATNSSDASSDAICNAVIGELFKIDRQHAPVL